MIGASDFRLFTELDGELSYLLGKIVLAERTPERIIERSLCRSLFGVLTRVMTDPALIAVASEKFDDSLNAKSLRELATELEPYIEGREDRKIVNGLKGTVKDALLFVREERRRSQKKFKGKSGNLR